MKRAVAERYERHPSDNSLGVPFGWADLPCRVDGSVIEPDSLTPRFVARALPYQIRQLSRPWEVHPRTALAGRMLRDLWLAPWELGWRVAYELADAS